MFKLIANKSALSATYRCSTRMCCPRVDQMPTITRRPKSNAWKPDESFTQAVELVAVSCDSQALSSVGLYGIVIDSRTEGQTSVHSSDNVTISSCVMASEISEAPEIVILPPDAVPLICKVVKPDEGVIELDDTSLFYSNGDVGLLVKQVPAETRCRLGP